MCLQKKIVVQNYRPYLVPVKLLWTWICRKKFRHQYVRQPGNHPHAGSPTQVVLYTHTFGKGKKIKWKHHVKEDGLLEYPAKLNIIEEKRCQFSWWRSVRAKFVAPRKNNLIAPLTFLGSNSKEPLIKDTAFIMLNVLLPTAEDNLEMLRTEYEVGERPCSSIRGPNSVFGRSTGCLIHAVWPNIRAIP